MEREAARKGGNPSFRSRRGRSSRGSFRASRKSVSQSQLGIGQQVSQKQLDASKSMAEPAVSPPFFPFPSPLLLCPFPIPFRCLRPQHQGKGICQDQRNVVQLACQDHLHAHLNLV